MTSKSPRFAVFETYPGQFSQARHISVIWEVGAHENYFVETDGPHPMTWLLAHRYMEIRR